MSQPTEAHLQTQWKDVAAILEHERKAFAVNTPAYVTDEDQLISDIGAYGNDFGKQLLQTLAQHRGRLSDALGDVKSLLDWIHLQYGAIMGVPETNGTLLSARLYDWFQSTSQRVQSRGFTFGAQTFSGSGNGLLFRLTDDPYNFTFEAQHADAKTVKCVADVVSGASLGEELFEFRGAAAYPDSLKITGSGAAFVKNYNAKSARNSLLSNPAWQQCATSGSNPFAVTSMPGWTPSPALVGDGTDYKLDTTNVFRGYPGVTSPGTLRSYVSGTSTITQALSVRPVRIDANRPYFCAVAWNRQPGTWTGTLQLTLGSQSVSVTVSAQTGWQLLYLPINTNLWYLNWLVSGTTGPTAVLTLTKTSGAGTWLNIGEVDLWQMDPFDGSWYTLVGGTTPFVKNDKFTFTDTEIGAVLQSSEWKAYGRTLPAAPVGPTGTIAVALAGAGSGNVDNGAHTYSFTYVDQNGKESLESGTAAVTVADHTTNGKVSVSSIAVGPTANIAKRNVYRSKAGTTSPRYFLATIADNVTTTFSDNLADSSLPSTVPPSFTMVTDPT